MTLIVKWLIYALAIFLVGNFLPGFYVDEYTTALWVGALLGILNVTIRPLLKLLALPITLLTLGLFSLIINGFMFSIAAKFIEGFTVDGFWWAVLGAVIVSLISTVGNRIFLGKDGKVGGT
jgi:putative membrane protein